eukprot:2788546-Amphidinium_carterae.1
MKAERELWDLYFAIQQKGPSASWETGMYPIEDPTKQVSKSSNTSRVLLFQLLSYYCTLCSALIVIIIIISIRAIAASIVSIL